LKWVKNIDWENIKTKKQKAPIKIDLYTNNVHDEFLQQSVDELNLSY